MRYSASGGRLAHTGTCAATARLSLVAVRTSPSCLQTPTISWPPTTTRASSSSRRVPVSLSAARFVLAMEYRLEAFSGRGAGAMTVSTGAVTLYSSIMPVGDGVGTTVASILIPTRAFTDMDRTSASLSGTICTNAQTASADMNERDAERRRNIAAATTMEIMAAITTTITVEITTTGKVCLASGNS